MNKNSREILRSLGFRVFAGIAILLLLTLIGAAVARTMKARNQSAATGAKKDALIDQIEKSADFPLAIGQDDDTPLRILAATVKEIPAADYEKLTSARSDSPLVVSVPQVKLQNVSSKNITRVMLIINDVVAQKSTGIAIAHLAISPGATFDISPANFVKPENLTSVDEPGKVTSSLKHPMKSKNFWLAFPNKSQLQVRVGVEFEDGTRWYNQNQRGERQ